MQTMEMQKEAVWDYIRNRLFLESTNLVYDCFSSTEQEKRFDHLPWPDEIAADFPNPCGWGTAATCPSSTRKSLPSRIRSAVAISQQVINT